MLQILDGLFIKYLIDLLNYIVAAILEFNFFFGYSYNLQLLVAMFKYKVIKLSWLLNNLQSFAINPQ